MARKIADIKLEKHGKRRPDKPVPIYFLSLTVKNVRCFGPKQTLDLSDGKGRPAQWTIILGDNGVGKTTLLQCLSVLLPVEFVYTDAKIVVPRYAEDLRLQSDWMPYRYNIEEIYFELSGGFFSGTRLIESEGDGKAINISMSVSPTNYACDTVTPESFNSIVCYGYGATRRMGDTSLSDKTDDDPTASLFSDNVALLNAEEWLLQADYAASKPSPIQARARERRDQIKEILISLLPDVTDIRFAQLSETQMKPGIEVETPYGWVSIKDLSLGYKTLIAWMVDLANRLFEKYSDSPDPLSEPAVVLVDEIDLHLHPKWQRTLMGYLSERFPNTQFIATAHSPLVVQSATDANIAVLRREGNHVVIDNDVEAIRGWRIDQILTSDLFGLESARPAPLDDLLAERKKILSKGKLTKKDRKQLQELEERIGPLPAGETLEDSEAMDIIRRAAERLKQL